MMKIISLLRNTINIIIILILMVFPFTVYGQFFEVSDDTIKAQKIVLNASIGSVISKGTVPFWIHSNKFGTISQNSPSGILALGFNKTFFGGSQLNKPYIRVALQSVANLHNNPKVILPEAYISLNSKFTELVLGRKKTFRGLGDSLLSSGSYSWSGNSIPLNEFRFATKGFIPIKFTKGFVSINAYFSHGWFADTDSMQKVMLHSKGIYGKLGKDSWKVKFLAGLSHYAQWGGYSPYLRNSFLTSNGHLPSSLEAYKRVLWPSERSDSKNGQFSPIDTINRSGNHLGSVEFAFSMDLKGGSILAYCQRPFEDMSGIVFGNFPDGLYGLSYNIVKKNYSSKVSINRIVLEFLYTLNHSGTGKKGNDHYFNNLQYLNGWTQKGRVIGTPFITPRSDIDPSLKITQYHDPLYITNNRVKLFHLGISGIAFNRVNFSGLISKSFNYGHPPAKLIRVPQLSFSVQSSITIWDSYKIDLNFSQDSGALLVNSYGLFTAISKKF